MATQVVNLLHIRSLNLGQIPVNLEFGQLGINTYNGIYPVGPTLYNVSLFVGTGGDERVDEDGTDRSSDVAVASALSGEIAEPGKGWVRYELRKVKVTGDTMVGDLRISGASVRFDLGSTGNAQLVLPDQNVSTTGEPGALRYSTLTGSIQIYDGTQGSWVDIRASADFQIANAAPAQRSTFTPLQSGDRWWNSATGAAYTYVGGVWEEDAEVTDSQVATVPPTTRANSGSLQAGDIYFDPTLDTQFVYDGAGWQKVIGSPGDYQIGAVAPTLRSSGDPLVPGDQWFDTTAGILKLWDGFAWFDVVQSANFQVAATAPATRSTGGGLVAGDLYYNTTFSQLYVYQGGAWTETGNTQDFQSSAVAPVTRSNTDVLQPGDTYLNTVTGVVSVWDGATWAAADTFRDYQAAAVAPTFRSDGVSALADGDFYYDTTLGSLFVRESGAWVSADRYTDFQTRTGVAPPGPTLRDNGVDALVEGDWWYDNSAVTPFLHFWDGTQWVNFTNGGTF